MGEPHQRGLWRVSADAVRTGIANSMSGRGTCFNDPMIEAVFKTLKAELVWRTIFLSRQQAGLALGRHIDGSHNPRRRHSALGYQSPSAFEAAT